MVWGSLSLLVPDFAHKLGCGLSCFSGVALQPARINCEYFIGLVLCHPFFRSLSL